MNVSFSPLGSDPTDVGEYDAFRTVWSTGYTSSISVCHVELIVNWRKYVKAYSDKQYTTGEKTGNSERNGGTKRVNDVGERRILSYDHPWKSGLQRRSMW